MDYQLRINKGELKYVKVVDEGADRVRYEFEGFDEDQTARVSNMLKRSLARFPIREMINCSATVTGDNIKCECYGMYRGKAITYSTNIKLGSMVLTDEELLNASDNLVETNRQTIS